jgi:hypothetical protein
MSSVLAWKPTRRVCKKSPPATRATGTTIKHRLKKKTALAALLLRGAGLFAPAGTKVDICFDWDPAFLAMEDLEVEDANANKAATIVTLPHPRGDASLKDLKALRAPGDFSHKAIETIMLDVFNHPVYEDPRNTIRRSTPQVNLKKFVIFKESHRAVRGVANKHYHVALLASRSFRFLPYKRSLRLRHGLASHWSTSHTGYWSTVRYGFMPTPKKPQADLDPEPRMWSSDGEHPSLFEASQEPTTSAALLRRRQLAVQGASAAGRREPKPTEMDLYAIIVQKGFRNAPDDPHAVARLVQHLLQHGSAELVAFAFRNRMKLTSIVDDVWAWETVDDTLLLGSLTRVQRLHQASFEDCVCGGAWTYYAEQTLRENGIDKVALSQHVFRLLRDGRREDVPVLVFVGQYGGEGKSFFLAPLRSLFGVDNVQATPESSSCPLLGLETKKVALLDEYRFCAKTLSLTAQLLWFEGKPFPITRPQNHVFGHLMYKGTAPIFITTKEPYLRALALAARRAIAAGQPCEETMLLRRLCVYHFTKKLILPSGHIPECASCFARMVVHYGGGA